MNTSIGFAAPSGSDGRSGATNAQCSPHFAPSAIQRASVSFCASVKVRFAFGGGMTSSGSSLRIRRISSLWSGSPGLTTVTPSISR